MNVPSPVLIRRSNARGDRKRRGDSAERIRDRIARAQRSTALVAGDTHRTGQALDDLVVGRRIFHRTVLAEPRDRAIDERWIVLPQLLVAHAEPIHDARAEVLDQHMRGADEPLEHFLPAFGFQVDGDGLLAAVLRQERGAHQLLVERGVGAELAREIALLGHFDLDHFRAQERELVGAERAREHVAQVQHPDSRQRLGHWLSLDEARRRISGG